MVDKLLALLVEFASKPGRWPLLLILIAPMLFLFVQEYFGFTFRDTVQNWLLWVGIGFTIITLGFAFLGSTLGSTGHLGRLWAPGILIAVGAAVAFRGYERGKAISLSDFVDQEHQQIVQALTEWVPNALKGDDRAQVLLGEFYARGILPGDPRFDLAKTLYESSAKKGNKRAATNLQIMYEEGIGVEKSTALSVYWQARVLLGGKEKIPIDLLRFAVDDHVIQELVNLGLAESAKQINVAGPTIDLIDPPLPFQEDRQAQARVQVYSGADEKPIIGRVTSASGVLALTLNDRRIQPDADGIFQAAVPLSEREAKVTIVAIDRSGRRNAIEFILASAKVSSKDDPTAKTRLIETQTYRGSVDRIAPGVNFGSYYALVIGNNDYQHLPKLETPVADAQAISQIFSSKYGFKVTTLLNANRYQILAEMNKMREKLTEEDNLLIYYAGHGELDKVNQRGNWLPVDAEPDSTAKWIPNVAITDILNASSANHILVISDACRSRSETGSLTGSALAQEARPGSALSRLQAGLSEEARLAWIRSMASQKSRTALSSGRPDCRYPVLDLEGVNHSIFARVILEILTSNLGVLEGQRLFQLVSARMALIAKPLKLDQVPEYAPIQYAGHAGGEFFFIPESKS